MYFYVLYFIFGSLSFLEASSYNYGAYGDRGYDSRSRYTPSYDTPSSKTYSLPTKPIDSTKVMEREMERLKDEKRRRTEDIVNDKFFNNLFQDIMQLAEHDGTLDPKQVQETVGVYIKKLEMKRKRINEKVMQVFKLPEGTENKAEVLETLQKNMEFSAKVEQKIKTLMPTILRESAQDIFPTPLIIFRDLSDESKNDYRQGVRIVDAPKGFSIPSAIKKANFQEDALKTLLIQRIMKGRSECQDRRACAAMDQRVMAQYQQILQRTLDVLDQQKSTSSQRGLRREAMAPQQEINTDAIISMLENMANYLQTLPTQQAAQKITKIAVASTFQRLFANDQHREKLKDMLVIQSTWADFSALRARGKPKLPWIDQQKDVQEKEKKETPVKGIAKKAKEHVGEFKETVIQGAKKKADDAVKTALSNLSQNILGSSGNVVGGGGNILGSLFG